MFPEVVWKSFGEHVGDDRRDGQRKGNMKSRRRRLLGSLLAKLSSQLFPELVWKAYGERVGEQEEEDQKREEDDD